MTHDLITSNMKLVWHFAHKFEPTAKLLGYDLEDIAQEGMIGLVKAANSFDGKREIKFSTFAARCIQNEIILSLRKRQKWFNHFRTVSIETRLTEDENVRLEDALGYYQDFNSAAELVQIIHCLPSREKEIIRLRLLGLSHREIAGYVGLSQSYVSRILARIQAEYRKKVNPA